MHPFSFYRFLFILLCAGGVLFACNDPRNATPTGTAGRVTCFEDEVAVPRPWTPGTPREGVIWDCVHVDLFLDELYDDAIMVGDNYDENGSYIGPM